MEMLFRCNILALVGGGRRPQWAPTKVVLWDDNQSKQVFELPFNSEVLSVKMRRDKLVVALEEKVQVFSLTGSVADTLSPLRTFKTFCNPRGLIALSWHSTSSVLAIPSLTVGMCSCMSSMRARAQSPKSKPSWLMIVLSALWFYRTMAPD